MCGDLFASLYRISLSFSKWLPGTLAIANIARMFYSTPGKRAYVVSVAIPDASLPLLPTPVHPLQHLSREPMSLRFSSPSPPRWSRLLGLSSTSDWSSCSSSNLLSSLCIFLE